MAVPTDMEDQPSKPESSKQEREVEGRQCWGRVDTFGGTLFFVEACLLKGKKILCILLMSYHHRKHLKVIRILQR